MKIFMKLMSVALVLGAVATASTNEGSNSELSVQKSNPTTILGHCDPLERLAGLCRSSENILEKN